jgi:apolipoprotein N-acyltransferase
MNELAALQSLGLELPSPVYIVGAVVFGLVGLFAWRRGRKLKRPSSLWLGVALMLYPYAISSTWLLYVVGVALCAGVAFDLRRGA